MRFSPYFYFRFGPKSLSVAYFPRSTRITLHSRQQTGAECYGTLADDRNTTSGSMESEYSTSQVTGSSFLTDRGFRIVDLRVQTAVFAVSVKPEVVVSRPEVILRDRKWLPPAQIQRLRSRRVWRSFFLRLCLHYLCPDSGRARV